MVDNYFLKLAKARKTTYEFRDKKVKGVDINKILDAGRWAPSCSNFQPWHFIVIQDKNKISNLMKITSYGAFHTDPTLIIALIVKLECWEKGEYRCIKNNKITVDEVNLCVSMAALNMVLEAEDIGINSAILTPEKNSSSKILRLRKGDLIPIMVGFGYERKEAFQKKRERKQLKELVSYEFFEGVNLNE